MSLCLNIKDLVLNHCWASIRASVNKDRVLVCGTQSEFEISDCFVFCHQSVLTLNAACMEIPFEHSWCVLPLVAGCVCLPLPPSPPPFVDTWNV